MRTSCFTAMLICFATCMRCRAFSPLDQCSLLHALFEHRQLRRAGTDSFRMMHLRGGGKPSRLSTLVLFDIDGTLTAPRKRISENVRSFLSELRKHVTVGVVGGSDLNKAKEQLGDDYLDIVDYAFAENGLVAFKDGKALATTNLRSHFDNASINRIVNFCLMYIADLDIPVKRGTFVEFRDGLINVSPIGRNCNQQERDEFECYDKEHGVRKKMISALNEAVGDLDLTYSIGGQISFDVFPRGWDKTFCLRFVEKEGFSEMHFFGDKTAPGGNDFEIFDDPRTVGHTVTSPDDTVKICTDLFLRKE